MGTSRDESPQEDNDDGADDGDYWGTREREALAFARGPRVTPGNNSSQTTGSASGIGDKPVSEYSQQELGVLQPGVKQLTAKELQRQRQELGQQNLGPGDTGRIGGTRVATAPTERSDA